MSTPDPDTLATLASRDLLREAVASDLAAGRYPDGVVTRFPPEPNGYLHIGHAKAIVIDFGIAADFGGVCNLRMDDTNPTTESVEFARNIVEDVLWLGFDPSGRVTYASDFYGEMYNLAERLIEKGLAYVDSSTLDEIRARRGTVTEPGSNSPFRDRSVADNLAYFRAMRAGDFADGTQVLRARIDMAAPNMLMRDPILYRIKHAPHFRTGDDWCIYPMYDYAHCLEDALEGVTHSFCTLEFENNRALYDWVLDNTEVVPQEVRPYQYETARLELEYVLTSKRKLKQLVDEGHVTGWDDPRMPTLAGLRRRGVPPEAIVAFIERVGVAKTNSRVEWALYEHCLRDHLERTAPRVMGVLDPLEVIVENWADDEVDHIEAVPWLPEAGGEGRSLAFGKRLWIERKDFNIDPPKGFKRLVPGGEVRLLKGYAIRHMGHELDADGQVVRVRVHADRDTRRGDADRRMGSIHWVDAATAVAVTARLYDPLFTSKTPGNDPSGLGFLELLNPDSLVEVNGFVEAAAAGRPVGARMQLMRRGYFAVDPDSTSTDMVLNRVVPLKSSWAPKAAKPRDKPSTVKRDDDKRRRKKRSPAEARAELRAADPTLQAAHDQLLAAGVGTEEADVLSADAATVAFVVAAGDAAGDLPGAATFIAHELRGAMEGDDLSALPTDGAAIGALVGLLADGTLTSRSAKTVLDRLLSSGGDPIALVDELGLRSIDDSAAVRTEVAAVLAAHPDEVSRYRAGEKKLQGFFMGQVMRATRGKADPGVARTVLLEMLSA